MACDGGVFWLCLVCIWFGLHCVTHEFIKYQIAALSHPQKITAVAEELLTVNPVRKRKILFLLFIASILMIVTALVLYALRQNISLFYTPTQVAQGEAPTKQSIRLGGMVVKGSIIRGVDDLSVQFMLTDYSHTLTISYRGILPDLFREEQGIVALGELSDKQHFTATEVLAKHDANYMPLEVRDALAKQKKVNIEKELRTTNPSPALRAPSPRFRGEGKMKEVLWEKNA